MKLCQRERASEIAFAGRTSVGARPACPSSGSPSDQYARPQRRTALHLMLAGWCLPGVLTAIIALMAYPAGGSPEGRTSGRALDIRQAELVKHLVAVHPSLLSVCRRPRKGAFAELAVDAVHECLCSSDPVVQRRRRLAWDKQLAFLGLIDTPEQFEGFRETMDLATCQLAADSFAVASASHIDIGAAAILAEHGDLNTRARASRYLAELAMTLTSCDASAAAVRALRLASDFPNRRGELFARIGELSALGLGPPSEDFLTLTVDERMEILEIAFRSCRAQLGASGHSAQSATPQCSATEALEWILRESARVADSSVRARAMIAALRDVPGKVIQVELRWALEDARPDLFLSELEKRWSLCGEAERDALAPLLVRAGSPRRVELIDRCERQVEGIVDPLEAWTKVCELARQNSVRRGTLQSSLLRGLDALFKDTAAGDVDAGGFAYLCSLASTLDKGLLREIVPELRERALLLSETRTCSDDTLKDIGSGEGVGLCLITVVLDELSDE